jgi:hypothetical protein
MRIWKKKKEKKRGSWNYYALEIKNDINLSVTLYI